MQITSRIVTSVEQWEDVAHLIAERARNDIEEKRARAGVLYRKTIWTQVETRFLRFVADGEVEVDRIEDATHIEYTRTVEV